MRILLTWTAQAALHEFEFPRKTSVRGSYPRKNWVLRGLLVQLMDGSVPRVFATAGIMVKFAFVRVNRNQLGFIENPHGRVIVTKLIYASK